MRTTVGGQQCQHLVQTGHPRPADLKAFSVLPEVVQRRLEALEHAIGRDLDEARAILRSLLGEIVLKPTPEGLKAQLKGNIKGLLTFDEQAPVFLSMVAGARFGRSEHLWPVEIVIT